MFKKNKDKKNAAKRQAISGIKYTKRDIKKVTSHFSEIVGKLWKPKLYLSMAVLWLGVVVYSNVNLNKILPIQSVKIEGEFEYLNKTRLREQALPVVNGGFFNVDLPAVRSALVDLPWVENVSVRRQWPDKLLVRVIEKTPVVLWGEKGVISARGELFLPAQKPVQKLPHLHGPQGQHKAMLKELARMQAWLLETGLRIRDLELNARRSWTLIMTSGMELRLGREQIHDRLNRFVSVYKQNLATKKREIKHIDMRYTNGFAVAWKEA